jgi:hypothetical protein
MATWLDIVGKPSDLADSDHRCAAVFLVKKEDATVQDPPTPAEQLPPQSKMSAAKDVSFANGEGVAQDKAEAVRLYRLAAAQGHVKAAAALKRLGV